jgi:hypothetical protein
MLINMPKKKLSANPTGRPVPAPVQSVRSVAEFRSNPECLNRANKVLATPEYQELMACISHDRPSRAFPANPTMTSAAMIAAASYGYELALDRLALMGTPLQQSVEIPMTFEDHNQD